MSPAFRALKPAAREILIQIYFEVDMSKKSKRSKWVSIVTNRDEIKLPYREISERLGYSDKCIWESFKQIIAHGFLKIIKYGGGAKGDVKVYGITEEWRTWQKGQVIRPMEKNGKIGWQKKK